jgi:hypothetical protein
VPKLLGEKIFKFSGQQRCGKLERRDRDESTLHRRGDWSSILKNEYQ